MLSQKQIESRLRTCAYLAASFLKAALNTTQRPPTKHHIAAVAKPTQLPTIGATTWFRKTVANIRLRIIRTWLATHTLLGNMYNFMLPPFSSDFNVYSGLPMGMIYKGLICSSNPRTFLTSSSSKAPTSAVANPKATA